MPTDFFTLETLGTFAGMVAAVVVIVQFAKGLFKASAPDWFVRVFTAVVALAVQGFVLFAQGNLAAESIGLGVINAILVALTAMGAYEAIADPAAVKTRQPQ